METTGLVTSYKRLVETLKDRGLDVEVNADGDYDILHAHSMGPLAVKKIIEEKNPVVMTSHTIPQELAVTFKGGTYLSRLLKGYMKFVYNSADLIISPSPYTKERLRKMGVKRNIIVQSNGIERERFKRDAEKGREFREKYDIPQDSNLIGCVGFPSKRKGLDVFVELAKKMPDTGFLWAGKNVFGRLLRSYSYVENIKKRHPDNLLVPGFVEDIQAAYSAMDVFLFPSRVENEGIVVLEAMSSQLPVITSRIGGLSWCKEGKYCLKASEVEEYIKKIEILLSDQEKRKKLVDGSKEILEKKDIYKVADNLIRIYRKLCCSS